MCVHIRPCGFALDPAAPASNASLLSFNSLSYWFSEWLDWRYTLPNYLFSEGSFERTYVSEHWAYVAHNTFEPLISLLSYPFSFRLHSMSAFKSTNGSYFLVPRQKDESRDRNEFITFVYSVYTFGSVASMNAWILAGGILFCRGNFRKQN